ncbi:hypothetical protein GCM10017559_08230 [Streptosporangium longisporum]|uniref:Uncharacterized protein n=1 Tax=Streptosporangium longisporum TaxID=46187 RepID=A0ABP6KAY1_9ACTN
MTRVRAWACRVWHTLTDPPGSDTAAMLALFIPIGIGGILISVLPAWHGPPLVRISDLVWTYALLHVVRQRDHARTQLAQPATTTGGS